MDVDEIYFGLKPICFDIMGMDYVLNDAPVLKMKVTSPKNDIDQIANTILDLAKNRQPVDRQQLHDFARQNYMWSDREKDIREILEKI